MKFHRRFYLAGLLVLPLFFFIGASSANAAAFVLLTADPNPVAYGARTALTWTSSAAFSCTASGPWSNGGTTSGSGLSDPLYSNTTFTFTCVNAVNGEDISSSVTVAVNPPPAPTASITSSPANPIPYNSSATVSWSSTNTSSCSVT
ncbi:MAG: hypothetical protein WC887_03355, partial [Candidatus Paceibacterota bacterium]